MPSKTPIARWIGPGTAVSSSMAWRSFMAHTKARRHKEDGKNQLFGFCDVALDTEPSIKSLPYLCAFVPLCEYLSAGAYAPRIRETSGNDKSFVARNSRGPFFSS